MKEPCLIALRCVVSASWWGPKTSSGLTSALPPKGQIQSIALDQVEWVRYHVKGLYMNGPTGIGKSATSRDWFFEVGRYPGKGAAMAFAT
jgi:predicted ATPase